MPLLLYPNTLGNMFPQFKSHSCCHVSLSYIMDFDIKVNRPEFKAHADTHHIVIM